MAMRAGLHWQGAAVQRRVGNAVQAGLTETVLASLGYAQPRAAVRTGFLRNSGFAQPAVATADGWSATWGFSALYSAYVEMGTVLMQARPYIRPAMDAEYPRLAERIRLHYERGSGG